MKILSYIPYNKRDKNGKPRFHALIQFDSHSFEQNILSFENILC